MSTEAERGGGLGSRFCPRRGAITGLLMIVLVGIACDGPKVRTAVEKLRPVRTLALKTQVRPVQLDYIGTTQSKSVKKYSFKVPGRLQRVLVGKGDRIARNQRLAQLDTKDLGFAVAAAELTLQQAHDAYQDSERVFGRVKKLFEQQAAAETDYEKARLQRDVRRSSLEQAQVDHAHKKSLLNDATIVADVDGYVVEVLNRIGEMVAAGYPVIVVRNERQIVAVGVSQRDVKRILVGTPAVVQVDSAEGTGQVANIAQVPDRRSRTYDVEIELTGRFADNEFYIGSIARVRFQVGTATGIWIPVQALLTDGIEYVFVIEEGRAVRRNVQLREIAGTEVRVEGLADGSLLIVEGMKNLKEGYRVTRRSSATATAEHDGQP